MEEEGKGILDEFAKAIPQNIEVKSVFEVARRVLPFCP